MRKKKTQTKLTAITQNCYKNLKQFWNVVRNIKRNNVEYIFSIKTDDRRRLFNENDSNEHTAQYETNLYTRTYI